MSQTICYFVVALYLLTIPVLSFGQRKDPTRITVTYLAMSPASLVTWVGKDVGIYLKRGLDSGPVPLRLPS